MSVNLNQYHYPFSQQENQLENIAITQDPPKSNSLNLVCSAHEKTEMDNSFLSILSGPSHSLQNVQSQLPNTRYEVSLNDPAVCDSCDIVTSGSPLVPLPHAAAMVDFDSHLMGNKLDGLPFATRQWSQSMYNQPLTLHDSLQTTPFLYSSNSSKPDGHRAFYGNGTAVGLPSSIKGTNIKHFNGSISPSGLKAQFQCNKVSEMKSVNSNHTSAYETGTLRVFCMGTVGELFLNGKGLLVVICSCHCLHMSVEKFSKHSGSLLSNPGEAVHLESGQTIAQWRRIFYMSAGIKVTDDDGGWDWPDCLSLPSGLFGSKQNNKLQAAHIESSQPQKFSSVFGEKNTDSFPYIKQLDLRHAALEELSNETSYNASRKNLLNRQNSFIAYPNVSTCGSALQPSNIRMMQEMKEDHGYGDLWMSKCDLVSNKGKSNIGHQFCSYPVENINGGVRNQSTLPNCSIGNDIVPGSITSTSGFELGRGHPFHQNDTFVGPIAYMQRQQSEQMFNSNKKLALFPSVTKETQHHLWNAPPERSIYNRNLLQHGSTGAADSSEPQEFNNELSKSSPLSLFLSQLNTFGSNASSQVADSIHNSYEIPVPELPHVDSYAECRTTNVAKRSNDKLERTLEMIRTDSPCPVNNGRGIIASYADGSYALSRLDSVEEMDKAGTSKPSVAIDKHSLHGSSAVISCQASNYLNHCPEIQVKVTDARHPDESGEIFCTEHDNQEHSLPGLRETLPSSNGVTSFLQASNTPSLNSVYISNGTPHLSTKGSVDASHFLDQNLRILGIKHMSKFSQQKYGSSSLDTTPHQEIECSPLHVERHRMNSQEDPRLLVEQRQCCCFKRDNSQATAKVLQCLNCRSTNTIQIVDKLGTSVLDASCCHTSSATRRPLCSRGHLIQCKLRCDEPVLFRPERMKNNCINSIQREISNLKEQSSIGGTCKCHNICNGKEHKNNSCGRCGCHTHPICLLECCYSQEGNNCNQTRQHKVCGRMEMLQSPTVTTECIEQDVIAFNGCGGLKEHIFMNDNCHLTAWRDVPGNMVGNSNVSCIEKSGHDLQATNIIKGQDTNTDFKESDDDFMEAKGEKVDEISNVCSECSGPRTSSDINISASCSGGISNSGMANDLVDEESAVERCGSSGMSFDSRNWNKQLKANGKVLCRKDGVPYQSSVDLRNMLEFQCPSKFRKLRSHLQISRMQNAEKKQMLTTNMEKIDASKHDSVCSPVDCNMPYCSDQAEQQFSFEGSLLHCHPEDGNQNVSMCASKESKLKRQQSSLSYNKISPSKRPIKHNGLLGNDYLQLAVDCSLGDFPSKKIKKASHEAKNASNTEWNDGHERAVKHTRYMFLCGSKKFNYHGTKNCKKKLRPVVCGEHGIIAIGDLSAQSRSPKIVSLSSVLKKARKRTILESEYELTQPSKLVVKKTRNSGNYNNFFMMEKKDEGEGDDQICSSQTDKDCFSARICINKSSILDIERNNSSVKSSSSGVCFGLSNGKIKRRPKEIRKRSLNELIGNIKGPSCNNGSFARKGKKKLNCELLKCSRRLVNAQISQDRQSCPSQTNTGNFPCQGHKRPPTLSNSDAFCCVCGSSNKDEINRLIECNQCFIKVHQACYGILKVPKGFWYCRPCHANPGNMASIRLVCVLCGYEGGAMTRAVRGWKIIKSLLKAWKIEKISKPLVEAPSSENGKDDLAISSKLFDELILSNEHSSHSIGRPGIVESSTNTSQKVDLPKFSAATEQLKTLSSFRVRNSVTAGMLDSSVTQWVHMVCGLWTPGTRCTNVNTMSAFDVSGAVTSRKNMVCTICNRPGGSCIQCRVVNCFAYFHPWCAHQKGLLQSENEGVDDEKVGFYGRCSLHASHQSDQADSCSMDAEVELLRKKEFSCARTEGYKGRKEGNRFIHDFLKKLDENGGCIVSQEQMNAWLQINAQKLCAKRIKKQPVASSTETDCLREYTRYKQVKGWKQLVVYKSGIHALGLYTSLFISRGAMVVEYVGEIVGLHVADKREIEYQSGKKLQCKSACYFFRIDKDHIIDATRKGGIARFVNHSCLPNCVAKVISVRNEKKVVFFAERDINPGEEITYDYNFNHEDEGKKIPCFCRSKNCRRYLN